MCMTSLSGIRRVLPFYLLGVPDRFLLKDAVSDQVSAGLADSPTRLVKKNEKKQCNEIQEEHGKEELCLHK
eukprot:scaffold10710_cov122-Skeletonema_dohrnii-CCMP3373.AAC.2